MIQIENTPNPNSLKFLSDKTISDIGTEEFHRKDTGKISNTFVKELLSFKGVELILLSKNFLSVKKDQNISWDELKPMVISHLNHYFEVNKEPILKKEPKKTSLNNEIKDETVKKIIEVLDTKIRPAVARDGGDIKFKSFEKGRKGRITRKLFRLSSSLMTLKQGVQNLLKHYVKEVNSVEAN